MGEPENTIDQAIMVLKNIKENTDEDDAVAYEMTQGLDSIPDEDTGVVEHDTNGTYTFTLRVNGGANNRDFSSPLGEYTEERL